MSVFCMYMKYWFRMFIESGKKAQKIGNNMLIFLGLLSYSRFECLMVKWKFWRVFWLEFSGTLKDHKILMVENLKSIKN